MRALPNSGGKHHTKGVHTERLAQDEQHKESTEHHESTEHQLNHTGSCNIHGEIHLTQQIPSSSVKNDFRVNASPSIYPINKILQT